MEKDIIGFEELYTISDTGVVMAKERKQTGAVVGICKQRKMKCSTNNTGYCCVLLRGGAGVKKKMYVHRLVAIHFIENPNNYKQINHIDGNIKNNNKDNLEWCTASMNIKHSFDKLGRVGTMRGKFGSDHNRSKPIMQMNLNGDIVAEFGSGHEAMRLTGVPQQNISKVLKGKRNSAGGFIWKYIIIL